jgi:hypothetical protein
MSAIERTRSPHSCARAHLFQNLCARAHERERRARAQSALIAKYDETSSESPMELSDYSLLPASEDTSTVIQDSAFRRELHRERELKKRQSLFTYENQALRLSGKAYKGRSAVEDINQITVADKK